MIAWGVTARETSWKPVEFGPDLGDIAGWAGHAFVRDLVEGVKYIPPPDLDGLRAWVRRTEGGAECFVMPFAGDHPPACDTVLDLQKKLAAKRKVLKDGDPDLDRLDRCLDRFLAQVSELHERQVPLGFVHPKSVLFCSDPDGGDTVHLPDLGFVFDVDAWVMGRPAWLSAAANNAMFDESARDRNKSYWAWAFAPSDETFQPLAAEDVRIAARLVAFALAGEDQVRSWCGEDGSLAEVPPPGNGLNDTVCRPVWDVLHRGIRGEVQSVAELRELLAGDARPSRHFLVKPPPPPPPVWVTLLKRTATAAAAAAAAAMVAWGLFLAYKKLSPKYTEICDHVWSWDSTLYPLLADLEKQKPIAGSNDESKQRFLDSVKTYVATLRETPGHKCDESCTEKLLLDTAVRSKWIDERVEEVVKRLRDRPRPTSEEIAELTAERTRIAELDSLRRESSSSMFQSALARLDRQLSLRGADPAARDAAAEHDTQ